MHALRAVVPMPRAGAGDTSRPAGCGAGGRGHRRLHGHGRGDDGLAGQPYRRRRAGSATSAGGDRRRRVRRLRRDCADLRRARPLPAVAALARAVLWPLLARPLSTRTSVMPDGSLTLVPWDCSGCPTASWWSTGRWWRPHRRPECWSRCAGAHRAARVVQFSPVLRTRRRARGPGPGDPDRGAGGGEGGSRPCSGRCRGPSGRRRHPSRRRREPGSCPRHHTWAPIRPAAVCPPRPTGIRGVGPGKPAAPTTPTRSDADNTQARVGVGAARPPRAWALAEQATLW
jgi:hypothetical protein